MPILSEPLRQKITALFPRYPSKRAVTLPALHMVQEHLRCVPHQEMAEIAELLEITPAEVHDTMSFYGFFPQAPIGDVRVWICRSLSCMLTGGEEMLEHACQRLGVGHGGTTGDGKLTVEFAECLGICDFAPAALADDGRIFGPLNHAS
ncbi:MAG: NAD(P)H-dependent oxidoreductase subunit E, partial [Planctomycetaceae bacterium]|nr:NAD(P)H-dependent oxidoreductase subunit E [Planctomycetaceae bacterium]